MKKYFFTILCICTAIQLHAEGFRRHNVSVSSGILTEHDILAFIGNVAMPAFLDRDNTSMDVNLGGSYDLCYEYMLTPQLGIGAVVGMNINSVRFKDNLNASIPLTGWYHNRYFHIMPLISYRWLNRGRFSMYSSAAAGLDFVTETDKKKIWPAWQLTAAGGEYFFGRKANVGLFAEIGAGCRGVANIGLRTRF